MWTKPTQWHSAKPVNHQYFQNDMRGIARLLGVLTTVSPCSYPGTGTFSLHLLPVIFSFPVSGNLPSVKHRYLENKRLFPLTSLIPRGAAFVFPLLSGRNREEPPPIRGRAKKPLAAPQSRRRGPKRHEADIASPGARTVSPLASGPPGRLCASTGWVTGSKQKKSATADGE